MDSAFSQEVVTCANFLSRSFAGRRITFRFELLEAKRKIPIELFQSWAPACPIIHSRL
jgi:hypothetical protein